MATATQPTAKPTRKISYTALWGALATLAVTLYTAYGALIPAPAASLVSFVIAVVGGYATKERV